MLLIFIPDDSESHSWFLQDIRHVQSVPADDWRRPLWTILHLRILATHSRRNDEEQTER